MITQYNDPVKQLCLSIVIPKKRMPSSSKLDVDPNVVCNNLSTNLRLTKF